MARVVPEEGFDLLKDRVQKAVSGLFPIVGKKNTLELHDVAVRDNLNSYDVRSQKEAKLEGKSWAVPVEATVSLKDNVTGRVIDRQKIKLMSLPKVTNRYSQIVDGQEYQVDNQWRLKPGVYNMVKADGALESHFNAPGGGFKVHFDPATREFFMGYGNSNIPLKPLLHAMGVPEDEVEKRWGKDIAVANHADMSKALSKFYKADTGLKPLASTTPEDMRAHFWQVMDGTKMNPDVNMLTLGKAHSNVTGATLLDASDKLLKISRGEARPDPRDAIMFKDLHSMEDFAAERITRGSKDILRKIGNTVDKKDKVRDIIAPDIFNRHIRQLFSKNSLSSVPSQTNPLEMISAQFKTTITGDGGIKSEHTVSDEAKLIDPSHLGFLDPIHTPEGKDTGITLRLPIGVTKRGHDVTIKMYNLHTGKNEEVNPTVAYKSHVVLPDQVRWVDGKPVPIKHSIKISGLENEIYDGPMKGADYVMKDPMQMFSFASNMIPFMPADHPNRSTMAGRQMEQAVSLLHRETPLVQSLAGVHSFDHMVGGFASHHTRVDGTVSQIKSDAVIIKGTDGKKHEVQIYDHFPLNEDKAFMHSTPIVKVGDKVSAGQTIADTNFSRNGVLAMGTNLRVGFMPYKGYNYEDGIVVTESAAKKLTSMHLHRHSIDRDIAHVLDKRKFQAYIPTGMNRAQAEKLDDDGVIKPGTIVMPGDTLIAALRASNESEKREDVQLSKLHKSIVRPFKDASVTWDNDYPGVVKEVVKTGTSVSVHTKTEEPLEIGDKITGRHGNKGICHDQITEVLTDSGWKYWKDLDRTELLCTRNQSTGKIEYQKPISYTSYRYKGKMYRYAGRRLDLCTTPEHNHFVRTRHGEFGLVPAEECFGFPRIHLRTGDWRGEEIEDVVIPGRPDGHKLHKEFCTSRSYDADLFLEFFGLWVTEGCLSHTSNINIAQSKEVHPEIYDRIVAVVEAMGYRAHKGDNIIGLSDPRLNAWLKQFGKSHDKFIPRQFLEVSKRQLRILADALFQGDGGVYYREKDNHTRYELFTSSKQLADDYQELALKLGMSANIKPQKGEYGTEYVVRWSLKDEVWTNNDKRFDNESWVDYNGMVYCAEVPNHVIYVRRNGIPVWSGNCTKIIPDHEAPHTKDGRPLDVILNPLGVTGRTNLGQVLEVAAGKIAEKTGKTYFTKNFKPDADLHAQVTQDLAKHGLTDKETVYDPMNERPMGDVLVGPMHMLKLHHQVEKKLSARALGYGYAYDRNKIPKGGGPHGAQSLGVLGLYSMLAHGSLANLREMNTWKSDSGQGDQFWAALQAGEMLPTPKPTFAYNKFISLIKGLNVNVEKTGNSLILSPMTDKQVHEMSNGELKDPSKMTIAKTMRPEPGGLFDQKITGGMEGTSWSHFRLPEAFPNPVFEGAIVKLTGLKTSQYDGLIGGTLAYDPATGKIGDPLKMKDSLVGGKAFNALLGKIDVKKDLAAALEKLQKPTLKGAYLDDANKRVKFLKVLDRLSVSPKDAYMMQSVPVLPPSMRPLPVLPNGTISEEDINGLYKSLHLTASRYAKMSPLIPDEDQSKVELRQEVYDGLRALAGIGSFPRGVRRGILDYIAGKRYVEGVKTGPPKEGFFQEQLVTRKQDMTMRGTIIPEPSLSLDEVGIPKSAALELYKPFVIRELRNLMGISPLQAQQKMNEGGEIVDRALDRVILSRPILLKRDPVLHKYGIQAFKPRIVSGKAVQIHPLVTSGFNADFDGDAMGAFVPVGSEAVAEAYKMFPSNNLFSPATGKLMYSPSGESRLGLYGLTRVGAATSHEFSTIQDVETAVRKGTVKLTDQVKVGGLHSTVGRFMVAGALPESMRGEYLGRKGPLNASDQEELMTRIAKEHKNEYGQSINKLKDLGNMWSTQTAFSIGLSELTPDREARNRILAKADVQVSKLSGSSKDAKTIEAYTRATDELDSHFKAVSEEGNNLMLLHNMGMKGGTNTIRQIRAAPMLMANHKGEIIPNPVRKSYAEGLDIAGYWTATSGGRKGVIQKVQAVQEPGHITKQVMNSTMNNLILDHDCGTDKGISLSIDEEILDRFTAADVRLGNRTVKAGTLITPELKSAFRNNNVGKVVVRSPLRCLHGPGLCQKCYGLTENGTLPERGLNVGVLAGQAIGERATQLAMKAFHQGGTASSKAALVDQFGQVQDLLLFPKILPGSATLSTVSGKVTKLEKDTAGGHNVFIEGERHYIPQSRGVPVYDKKQLVVGTEVKKGMPISEGRVNPHEMLPLTGIEPVQALLASNLADMYAGQGIRRRNHEVVIKALTNLTKIKDAGSSTHFIRGDFAPTTYVSSLNRKMVKGEHPIVHEPILKGVNVLPIDMQEDWMAKLNHEGLAETVINAAQQGWRSHIHSLHPIPAVVYAAELGKPPKDLPGYFY